MNISEETKQYIAEKLSNLTPIFAKASIGDFSQSIVIPEEDDGFTQLYTGIGVMLDVIRDKIASLEQEIKERKKIDERLQRVLDNMIEGFQIIGFDWKYIYVNDSAARQGKRSKDDLLGHTMMEVYPDIEKTELFSVMNKSMEQRSANKMENVFVFPDGYKGWFELRIEPISEGIFILSVDVTQRKKQQEELMKIASIVESSDDAIIGKDLSGTVLSWNNAAEKMFGYSKEEILGKSISILFPPNKKEEFEEIMEHIKKGETVPHLETNRMTKDGKILDVSVTVSSIKNAAGEVIGASDITRDISDRKKAEEALKESEEHFRALVNATSDVIYRMNPDWSEMRELQGRKFLADTGKPIQNWLEKYIHPKDQQRVTKAIEEAIKNKTVFQLEHQVKQADGSLGWTFSRAIPILNKDGEIMEWFGAASDITKRKQQQEEVLRLAEIVASSEEAIIGKTMEGKITSWNKGAEQLYGYTESEMIGKPNNILIPSDRSHEWDEFSEKLAKGETIRNFETVRLHKDGRRIDVSITFSPIKDIEGNIIGSSAIVRDITERKKIDLMKNEFVALASHQLKTPLTAIKWYSELLLKSVSEGLSEKQIKYLTEVHRSNKRMIYLVNALLNVSRIDLGTFIIKPEHIEIVPLIEDLLQEYAVQITDRKIHIEKHFSDNLPKILLDVNVMRIVLSNLLLNAIRYSREEGNVSLDVFVENEKIYIKVSDSGIGIPSSEKDKIFKKFSRTDNAMAHNPDGSGLGLYMVKSLTDQSGGEISFTSEENKGTIFTLSFPLSGMKEKEGTRQIQ